MKIIIIKFFFIITTVLIFISSILIRTSNAQWVELSTGTTAWFWTISSPDNNTCWVSGNSATVLRTTNGGINWQSVGGTSIGTTTLYNIFAVDANTAITSLRADSSAKVFRTSNGGTNWSQVFTQRYGFINSIWMTSSVNGFMMGDPVGGRLYVLGNQIWFVTDTTRLYYSSNNGSNWSIQSKCDAHSSGKVWFNSPTNGMSSGDTVNYTSNSGTTWVSAYLQNFLITGLTGKGNYYFVCNSNSPKKIQMTSNSGLNWIVEYQTTGGNNLMHMTVSRNGNIGWACTDYGLIVKRTTPISITTQSIENPEKYILLQNYPNPFNPVTRIRYELPRAGVVRLAVYDVMGREVEMLVNERQAAGSDEAVWDETRFASGVYFYRLNAGDFIKTLRMILIK
ncbi:MAG: T9SS type A sorting domain-containing protein [Ignavibacteriae bacterium]|nr:T9SS type A sorting domain-containing protein [Ignavibacteriota bacterium]